MGSIYKRKEFYCKTCGPSRGGKRLARTADRKVCLDAEHEVEARESAVWWVKYTRGNKSYAESSRSDLKRVAEKILKKREGDIAYGKPVTPQMGRVTFDDAAADLLTDYRTNGKRSEKVVTRRVEKHLTPFFGGRRMAEIATPLVRAYIDQRQTINSVVRVVERADGTKERVHSPASNAEINRELALLKRIYSLAIQGGTLMHRPHIPMLRENNVRAGFFEPEQYASVLGHLPAEIRPIVTFAYLTGWRIASEVLPLEWRQIDFDGEEIRLDAGTTKNGDGRVFPFTADLRVLLKAQHAEHLRLQKAGNICRYVFFREVAEERGGKKNPHRIVSFTKAWKSACRAAGCPGRIPHDLRRTAVRNLVRSGIPERVAMRLTGHKTPSVFARYDIVSDGDLKEAAGKLDLVAAARLA